MKFSPIHQKLGASSLSSNEPVNQDRIAPRRTIRVLVAVATIAIVAEVSLVLREPFLFPSIGPTVIAVVSRPAMRQNRPVSIISAHYFGLAVAFALLFLFHLYGQPSTLQEGFTQSRVLVVTLSIGITVIFEENTPLYHPPAAATTLLVALGVMATPTTLLSIVVGIALIAMVAATYEHFSPKATPSKVRKRVADNAVTSKKH
jgi:hypothetical protein